MRKRHKYEVVPIQIRRQWTLLRHANGRYAAPGRADNGASSRQMSTTVESTAATSRSFPAILMINRPHNLWAGYVRSLPFTPCYNDSSASLCRLLSLLSSLPLLRPLRLLLLLRLLLRSMVMGFTWASSK